jgi:hypothetical protein
LRYPKNIVPMAVKHMNTVSPDVARRVTVAVWLPLGMTARMARRFLRHTSMSRAMSHQPDTAFT